MPTDNKRPRCKNPDCKRQFTRQQGSNRLYCFECRPERTKVLNFPNPGQSGEDQDDTGENPGPLTRKTLIQLEKWAVEDTWQAEACLTLARQIDSGKGGGSAGVAGAIKAHREAMAIAEAISTVEVEEDKIKWIFENKA